MQARIASDKHRKNHPTKENLLKYDMNRKHDESTDLLQNKYNCSVNYI